MKLLAQIAEIILGLTFIFGGINGLLIPLGFEAIIPVNPSSKFAVTLSETYYIFIIQKIVELVCGLLLVIRIYRFAALLALTPIVICIFAYHIVDDVSNLPIGLTVLGCYILSLTAYQKQIANILTTK